MPTIAYKGSFDHSAYINQSTVKIFNLFLAIEKSSKNYEISKLSRKTMSRQSHTVTSSSG